MSHITTKNGRTIIKKAESMMLVPYVYDNNVEDYVLGNDVYDISAIIGDSTTLEQSEGNTETKYNEFKASPLIESVSGSKYNFTAQCVDLQNSVLKSVFGAMTVNGVGGVAAFNDDFVLIYVLIRIRFKEANLPDVILPKVQLNSRLFINQLKTRASQGNIAGTALAWNCAVKDNLNINHLLQFSSPQVGSTFTPYTPVLFVPKSMTPMFYRSEINDKTLIYSIVNFGGGVISNDTRVNPYEGTWTTV